MKQRYGGDDKILLIPRHRDFYTGDTTMAIRIAPETAI